MPSEPADLLSKLPILDGHVHVWDPAQGHYPWMTGPYDPIARKFSLQDLVPSMSGAGTSRVILVQTWSSLGETREFLRLAEAQREVAGVVGWIDLTGPDSGAMLDDLIAGPGGRWLCGIRHQVHDEADPAWILRPDVRRGLSAVAARGLTYDLLVRPRELPHVVALLDAMPALRCVVDHIAKPDIARGAFEPWAALMAQVAARPNAWCKLSGMVTQADWARWTPDDIAPYIAEVLRLFGPERCLVGSDWPVCLVAADYGRTLILVRAAIAALPEAAQRAILWGTAVTAYRLAHDLPEFSVSGSAEVQVGSVP